MSELAEYLDPADLMDRLMEDKKGAVRDTAVARLRAIEQDLKSTLDSGVSPKEFEKLAKVRDAIGEASGVVEDAWTLMRSLQKG